MASTAEIVEVLGGAKVLGAGVRSSEAVRRRIRDGLPYARCEHVALLLAVNLQELGEVLDLPKSTRASRRSPSGRHVLSPSTPGSGDGPGDAAVGADT